MKKRYTGTQIVAKLRQADVLIGKGNSVPEVCREIDVSQQTYYRWRQKYGGICQHRCRQCGIFYVYYAAQEMHSNLKFITNYLIDLRISSSA